MLKRLKADAVISAPVKNPAALIAISEIPLLPVLQK
jgi:hypothetical protein